MQLVRALVEGGPQTSASAAAQSSIGTTAAVVLLANAKRKSLIIQNTGLTILRFGFGLVLPTQTVYHFALAACTGADDGRGGIYFDDAWVGALSAVSSGAGGTFVMTEVVAGGADWNQSADWGLRTFLGGS